MIAKLQSSWIASLIGLLLYLGTTIALWQAKPVHARMDDGANQKGPSWVYENPEVDQLVADLHREKNALATRADELDEYARRLEAEQRELNQASKKVLLLRSEFDSNVVQVLSEEASNIKKLARTYSSMTPDTAATILSQMDETIMLRILAMMKDSEAAPILSSMAQKGPKEAQRVAKLSERLRLVLPPSGTGSK